MLIKVMGKGDMSIGWCFPGGEKQFFQGKLIMLICLCSVALLQ